MVKLLNLFKPIASKGPKNFFLAIMLFTSYSSSSQNLPLCLNAINSNNSYTTGSAPRSIVNVDFNGDGNLDVAVVNQISNNVNVFIGDGSGGFSLVNTYTVGSQPLCLVYSDFNNDGNVDLATANYSSQNITILLGSGSGAFTVNTYTFGTSPNYLESGDFNGDGKIDLASANGTSNNISIMLGSGTGTFSTPTNYISGNSSNWIIKSDFNSDGKIDLATTNYHSDDVSIFLGSGTGTFAAAVNYSVPAHAVSLTQNDFNGDGNKDLAISCTSTIVSILFGSPTGTFSTPTNYTVPTAPQQIINADLNNDGNTDLIMAHLSNANSISILLGSNSGSFTAGPIYVVGSTQISITSGDCNGDGIVDIQAALWGGDRITVCIGRGNAQFITAANYKVGPTSWDIASADFNNDSFFDIAVYNRGPSKYVNVFFGTAAGTLQPSQTYTLPGVAAAGNIVTADFNNDSRADLAVWTGTVVEVFLATVSGSFSILTNTLGIQNISAGDFNNDGKIDLVGGGGSGSQIGFCAGIGNGLFSAQVTYPTGSLVAVVCSGDFNNDGNRDVATGNNSSNAINIALGNGSGGFSSITTFSTHGPPDYIINSDLNNDNNLDLAVVSGYSPGISILLGQGNGSFPAAVNYTTTQPLRATISDINGDNKKDLLVVNNFSLIVFVGNGLGSFTQTIGYPMPNNNYDVVANDFNGDNKKDIALISRYLTIVLNGPALFVNPISPICLGNSATLSVMGADTYSWNTSATTSSIVVSPTTTSTYTVFATTTNGCSNVAIKTISVHPAPTISVNNGSVCIGNSYTITPNGASSYTYASAGPVVTPTVNQTYTITGVSAQGCTNTAICNIVVNPLPTISVNSGTICSSQSFTMIPTGAATYTFSNSNAVVTPTISDTYTVIGTSALGCTNSAISTVSVKPQPTLSVNSGTICTGDSFTIIPNGANTYSFSSTLAIVTPTANETFTVIGTNSVGCTNSITSAVSVNPLPSITVNSGSICSGQSFTMIPSGAITYTFSNSNSVVTPTVTETYTVIGSSAFGCTNTAMSIVSVQSLPTVSVNDGTTCAGQTFTISPTGAITYSYINAGPVVTPTVTDSYTITGASAFGCTNSAVCNLTVFALPILNTSSSSTLLCLGQTATLIASGANSYSWSSSGTNSFEIVSPSISTNYTVIGTDNNGCSNSSVVSVSVSACTDIANLDNEGWDMKLYPNPTSGIFTIETKNVNSNYNVFIFNSIGQLLYKKTFTSETSSLNISELPSGSYFLRVTSYSGQKMFRLIKE